MSRNWTIRPVVEQDFPEIAITETAREPEPISEKQVREWEKSARTDEQYPNEWFVGVEKDGSPHGRFLGWGHCGKSDWLGDSERTVYVGVQPVNRGAGVGSFLLEYAEGQVKRDNPTAIYAWARGADRPSVKWASNRGYVVSRERTESFLDLVGFDAGKYQADLDRVKHAGIEIRTVWNEQVEPLYPGLFSVAAESHQDLPFRSADAPDLNYKSWLKEIEESTCHRVFAIALHDGQIVGYSHVWMPEIEGQSAVIDYTGVLREYRGRGIALAVKVAAAVEAAQAGAKLMRTNNDPDNPAILRVNEKMGFLRKPGPVILKKELAPDRC